jgi:hypothetical protein
MKKYFGILLTVVVMMVILGLVGYAWQNMPWYYATDDTLDTIVIVAGTAAVLMGIDALIEKIRTLFINYKIVIKLEKREIPETIDSGE